MEEASAIPSSATLKPYFGTFATVTFPLPARNEITALRSSEGKRDRFWIWRRPGGYGGKGVGCWVLGVGCWVLGVGCWVLGVGCWVKANFGSPGKQDLISRCNPANFRFTSWGLSEEYTGLRSWCLEPAGAWGLRVDTASLVVNDVPHRLLLASCLHLTSPMRATPCTPRTDPQPEGVRPPERIL